MAHGSEPVVNATPLASCDVQAGDEEQEADEFTSTLGPSQDHYGFLKDCDEGQMNYDPTISAGKAREREQKWLKMLHNWKWWMEHKPEKVKERCRKGIPDSLRGQAWLIISGADKLLAEHQDVFDKMVAKPDNDTVIHVIDKDLDRTFPSHVLFAKKGCKGQRDLRLVLKAYAMYNEKTGYCQAMAPVAATLLMHMVPEQAFWCLVQICEEYLPGYYSPGLHAFQIDALILKDLVTKYIPPVAKFLDSKLPPTNPNEVKRGLDPVLYCTEWFMSIFSRSLPWPSVLRVWDMFFFEGVKVLFKVGLAILHLTFSSKKDKDECPGFFEVTRKLRNLPLSVTHEEKLIPEVLRFHLNAKELHKEHIAQADFHFSEERARLMELSARRMRYRESTVSNVPSE